MALQPSLKLILLNCASIWCPLYSITLWWPSPSAFFKWQEMLLALILGSVRQLLWKPCHKSNWDLQFKLWQQKHRNSEVVVQEVGLDAGFEEVYYKGPGKQRCLSKGIYMCAIKTVSKTSMKWMKNTGVLLHDLPENEPQMGFAMQIDPFPHRQLASIQY